MNRLALWLATLGPVGRIKWAPGTWGSLCAVPVLLLAKDRPFLLFVFFVIFCLLGIWSSGKVAIILASKDPSIVVIDEVCGMLTCFFWVPINGYSLAIGFGLFRLFDVLKPPPIRRLEKLPGGTGIVLDDIGAGIYANLILQVIFHYA